MPRDHARINLAIWNDDDFLDLPPLAQHLYLVLWTHPDLSFAGVVDWRPARLAQRSHGWTTEDVILAGKCLEARLFTVTDEETEECLIRSWVRWDGLLKQPIMAVSFANARAAVSSRDIRGVIVYEARKLHKIEPKLPGWAKPQVQELLAKEPIDPRARALPKDPLTPDLTRLVTPDLTLRAGVGVNPWPNPTPTPTPSPTPSPSGVPEQSVNDDDETTSKRKPERPLPADWVPTAAHYAFATEKHVSIEEAIKTFRNHADTNDRRCRNWNGAFHTWLDKSKPSSTARTGSSLWDRPAVGSQP